MNTVKVLIIFGRETLSKCIYVNKPPRPVGTGKRLTGGSAATERRKDGETKEEECCYRSFSLYGKSYHRKERGKPRVKQ